MTNYNERLDYILRLVFNYGYNEAVVELDPTDKGYDKFKRSTPPDIASKAITSLIKELVAEAKPELPALFAGLGDISVTMYKKGTDEFEQNLLKALEEV